MAKILNDPSTAMLLENLQKIDSRYFTKIHPLAIEIYTNWQAMEAYSNSTPENPAAQLSARQYLALLHDIKAQTLCLPPKSQEIVVATLFEQGMPYFLEQNKRNNSHYPETLDQALGKTH